MVVRKTKDCGRNHLEYILEGYFDKEGREMVKLSVITGCAYVILYIHQYFPDGRDDYNAKYVALKPGDTLEALRSEFYQISADKSDIKEFDDFLFDIAAYMIYYPDNMMELLAKDCGKDLFD